MENSNFTGLIIALLLAFWMFTMGENQKKRKEEEEEEQAKKDKNKDNPHSTDENTKES